MEPEQEKPMIEHDDIHMVIVDSYTRDILLHDHSDECDDGVSCPLDRVPADLWPCIDSSILALCQATLEVLAELAGRTFTEEVDSWLAEGEAG